MRHTHPRSPRVPRRTGFVFASIALLAACGGPAVGADDAGADARRPDGALGEAGSFPSDAGPRDAPALPYRDVPPVIDPEPDADCPPGSGGIERDDACEFLNSAGTCAPGQGCVEELALPEDPVCGGLRVRHYCDTAGTVPVGERCNYAGGERCVPGAFCLAVGSDNRCYRACVLGPGAPEQCPRGMLCEPTDSPDWGVCL